MTRIDLLIKHGVTPIMVFDGGRMPMKAEEEDSRRRGRAENRAKAAAHMAAGNVSAALEFYQRCVDVTPAMAKQVIEVLKDRGVQFYVAPYEADAQMAYLALRGAVHAVITEDSDLLAYGCPRVLFKIDKFGNGEEIRLEVRKEAAARRCCRSHCDCCCRCRGCRFLRCRLTRWRCVCRFCCCASASAATAAVQQRCLPALLRLRSQTAT